ncbi:DISP1 [Bugula neritina]|uniref:DISP1 n=1 Tax=Bugula neritina TaxID=10212 RepID=A0A7J7KAS0_BUGNE|nr:DISP1 [Bugula neritina]
MGRSRYAELLTHYPVPILAVILVVVCSCTLLSVLVAKPPDFSDPLQGFIPRYTDIHSSYRAWHSLVENTAISSGSRDLLTFYPLDEKATAGTWNTTTSTVNELYQRFRRSSSVDASNESDSDITSYGTTTPDFYAPFTGRVLSPKEQFFCDSKPRGGYAQLAFSISEDIYKMNFDTFTQLCQLQADVESSEYYKPVCQFDCMCRSFSLVNYVAYLSNRSSCFDVIQPDMTSTLQLLQYCYTYYETIPFDCWYGGGMFHSRRCNV